MSARVATSAGPAGQFASTVRCAECDWRAPTAYRTRAEAEAVAAEHNERAHSGKP